jgi:hypothetical protein
VNRAKYREPNIAVVEEEEEEDDLSPPLAVAFLNCVFPIRVNV